MSEGARIPAKTPEARKENLRSQGQRIKSLQSYSSPIDQIMFLQRTLGNRVVQRLIKSGALQAKLKIGQPGDKYEQEADRVAEQVIHMPEPYIQRQPEEEKEEELVQTKPLTEQITLLVQRQVEPEEEEKEEVLQTNRYKGQTPEVTPDLESRINALKGGGQSLSQSERAFFEPRFGYNFSHIRIYKDAGATETARDLNAQAFTRGRDIVFGAGQYSPETTARKKLLAHELTHVIQQEGRLQLKEEKYNEDNVVIIRLYSSNPNWTKTTITISSISMIEDAYNFLINDMHENEEYFMPNKGNNAYWVEWGHLKEKVKKDSNWYKSLKDKEQPVAANCIKILRSRIFEANEIGKNGYKEYLRVKKESRAEGELPELKDVKLQNCCNRSIDKINEIVKWSKILRGFIVGSHFLMILAGPRWVNTIPEVMTRDWGLVIKTVQKVPSIARSEISKICFIEATINHSGKKYNKKLIDFWETMYKIF